jgi:hypothetical protein
MSAERRASCRTSGRSVRSRFQVEPLEGRQLLSVLFQSNYLSVGDRERAAVFTLVREDHEPLGTTGPEQVELTAGGGTAVPGVDYEPLHQTVTFEPGEITKTVRIPVLPADPSAGTRTLRLILAPTPTNPAGSEAILAIAHGPDATPPRVVATRLLTKGSNVTGFVLTFSEEMARGAVEDVNNYAVDDPRSIRPVRGVEWTEARRRIALKSAVYDPATRSVTLTPAGRVRKGPFFSVMSREVADLLNSVGRPMLPSPEELTLLSPITDAAGNPLDGDGDGVLDETLTAPIASGRAGRKFIDAIGRFGPSAPPSASG